MRYNRWGALALLWIPVLSFSQKLNQFYEVSQSMNLQGNIDSVAKTEGGCIQLTSEPYWGQTEDPIMSSAIWHKSRVDLSNDFHLEFDITYFEANYDMPADGFAFVLQNQGEDALGHRGRGIGYDGIANSLAVEFDVYYNMDFPTFEVDYHHLSVAEGEHTNLIYQDTTRGGEYIRFPSGRIDDGMCRRLIVNWNASDTLFEITYDGERLIALERDLVNRTFGGEPSVFWGFTGSIGAYSGTVHICMPEIYGFPESICEGEMQELELIGYESIAGVSWSPESAMGWTEDSSLFTTLDFQDSVEIQIDNGCSEPKSIVFAPQVHEASDVDTTIETFCQGIQLYESGKVYEESGVFTDTLTNANGCDSVIHIDLTIISPTVFFHLEGDTLVADIVEGQLNWVDCDRDSSTIEGADLDRFVPEETGNYALMVSGDGCSVLSDCIFYNTVGTEEILLFPMISFVNNIYLHVDNPEFKEYRISIYKVTGERVLDKIVDSGQASFRLDLGGFSKGVYLTQLITGSGTFTSKIVKPF